MSATTLTLVVVSCLAAFLFALYLPVAMLATKGMHAPISCRDVRGVARELIGKALRAMRRRPALPQRAGCFEVFDLHRNSSTYADVEAAVGVWVTRMRSHPWAYPLSQQQALRQHATAALSYAMTREISKQELQAEWAEQERAELDFAARLAVRGWRAVLNLTNGECNGTAVKKAYRTLVSAAHPDRGGSDAVLAELNTAMAQAREELNFV